MKTKKSTKNKEVEYQVIDGLKVAKSMSKKEKDAIRNDSNAGGDPNFDEKEHLDPKNIKTRITMMLDEDLLRQVKKRAKDEGLPYQTFINLKLRRLFLDERSQPVNSSDPSVLAMAILNLSDAVKRQQKDSEELKRLNRIEETLEELKTKIS